MHVAGRHAELRGGPVHGWTQRLLRRRMGRGDHTRRGHELGVSLDFQVVPDRTRVTYGTTSFGSWSHARRTALGWRVPASRPGSGVQFGAWIHHTSSHRIWELHRFVDWTLTTSTGPSLIGSGGTFDPSGSHWTTWGTQASGTVTGRSVLVSYTFAAFE